MRISPSSSHSCSGGRVLVLAAARFVEMPGRSHLSALPDDVVASILVLLPPREVARSRLVCRRWRALTTDHHFVRSSFLRRHAGHGHPVAGFFYNGRWGNNGDYFPIHGEVDEAAAVGERLPPDLSFISGTRSADPCQGNIKVHGSCNGLLLLSFPRPHLGAYYCVCNLLTKKFVPIVVPGCLSCCVSLAFDPSKSPHYNVITLGDRYSVHVYYSETRSWRMAIHSDHSACLFQDLRPARGVFWNGSVVWIASQSLIRFFIEAEHIAKMPMPPRKKDWICGYIGESGGHLQMIGYTKKEKVTACFDILEIKEGQSEWSVLYHVDLSRVKEMYPCIQWPTWDSRHHQHKIIDYLALSPIYVIRGTGKSGQRSVLVFSIPGKVMSYNMENQEISIVKEIALTQPREFEHFWFSFYAYNPSLFSL
ncbi:hypothetical protein EJB05_30750, partial [Eragrostis curvula]